MLCTIKVTEAITLSTVTFIFAPSLVPNETMTRSGLIENGYVYMAMPPLYRLKVGKKIEYVYTDEEKETALKKLNGEKVEIQRYKGLGEMNPVQLWDTTMNPETRLLKKINIIDAERADEIFRILMSEDVPPRKKFIVTHAHLATLDI
jgi:DNA gyrase subunit B